MLEFVLHGVNPVLKLSRSAAERRSGSFLEAGRGVPELLCIGGTKAERRAFCLLGYVSLKSLCLDEPCGQTVAIL